MSKLTHFDETGRAAMVDVSEKAVTTRKAVAVGQVKMAAATLALVQKGVNKKGDVFSVAELAGIMGAKRTSDLIPLCHPLPLSKVNVRIEVDEILPGLTVSAETKISGQTGVEMEALTAVSVACLTIYDMLKAADKHMVIGEVMLTEKTGGKSGDWTR
ncbi:cyclic pyranopterin monophosphate synthase MoaC [Hellea balneolensis]|uniref:cyclic pyranopterin monophosphate synthase MoaC n=1 Tax=Hellea balneolensis TaxID=287478 RepID=UPI000403F7FB|nr:cyclic pyranopterin monophosphate synthase MoaC [Hellea balneolensis]